MGMFSADENDAYAHMQDSMAKDRHIDELQDEIVRLRKLVESDKRTQRDLVEEGIQTLYTAFYRLHKAGKLQEEYDSMSTLISMLEADRQHMLVKYKGRITI